MVPLDPPKGIQAFGRLGLIQKRFEELADMAHSIKLAAREQTRIVSEETLSSRGDCKATDRLSTVVLVNPTLVMQWQTSILSLITRVFGEGDPTVQRFSNSCNGPIDSGRLFGFKISIFRAAKEEVDGGFLFNIENLAISDVLTSQLDQSRTFLDMRQTLPAVVIAGAALQKTLRRLCDVHLSLMSLETTTEMNNSLCDARIFGSATKQQISLWLRVYETAITGHAELDHDEVKHLIDGTCDLISKYLT